MNDKTRKKIRTTHFAAYKANHEKIVMVTAYDYATALWANEANIEAVLVGDSLGMVSLGYNSTIPVTLDMMIHHTAAVRRGLTYPLLIADMPFMTTNISAEDSLRNAALLVQEGGAEAVKIEGGSEETIATIKKIVQNGIPVMGHIGLTPQFINTLGGYKIQGRDDSSAQRLIKSAQAIQEAGAFAVVLEGVTAEMTTKINEALNMPTIGIGANANCDGQILVVSDLTGLVLNGRIPKFAKQYCDLSSLAVQALNQYSNDVKASIFPAGENEYH